jgi:hypothetical protein
MPKQHSKRGKKLIDFFFKDKNVKLNKVGLCHCKQPSLAVRAGEVTL